MVLGILLRLFSQVGVAMQLSRVRGVRRAADRPLAQPDLFYTLDSLVWASVLALAAVTGARPVFSE